MRKMQIAQIITRWDTQPGKRRHVMCHLPSTAHRNYHSPEVKDLKKVRLVAAGVYARQKKVSNFITLLKITLCVKVDRQ